MIVRYLVSDDPRARLIEDYIYDLTGSSLQSAEEVGKTAGALGINDADLRRRIDGLKICSRLAMRCRMSSTFKVPASREIGRGGRARWARRRPCVRRALRSRS
jgi:hypothetical protein